MKYGPRAGGLLAGFPSTVPFSLAFIGWTQSAATAVEATTALPLALAFTAAFPLVYASLSKGGRFRFALAGSLVFWGTASFVLSAVSITLGADYWVSLVGFYSISAVFYITLARKQRPSVAGRTVRLTPFDLVFATQRLGYSSVKLTLADGEKIWGLTNGCQPPVQSFRFFMAGTSEP